MAGVNIYEQLNGIFCDIFDNPGLKIFKEMTARDVDGWDSLNHINLVVAVEKHFGIKFTTKEIMTYQNVGEFADAVEVKLAKK